MRYILFLFFLLSLLPAYSTDGQIGNVVYASSTVGESSYHHRVIAYLCHQYITNFHKFRDLPLIYLHLSNSNIEKFQVSFDNFAGTSLTEEDDDTPYSKPGIRIVLNTDKGLTEKTLKLLDYAILHLEELKKLRLSALALDDSHRPRRVSLDSIELADVLQAPTPEKIKAVVKVKVQREFKDTANPLEQTYFLQNDLFNFYNGNTVYLQLPHVFQIINVYYLGHLIFDTDHSFYYYDTFLGKLSEKFYVSTKKERATFNLVDYDLRLRRIQFEYIALTDKDKVKRKLLFLAEKPTLIQNYEEMEERIIEEYLKK